MDADMLFGFLIGLHPMVREALVWLGLVSTVVMAAITLSPWKGDDEALEQVKKMPFVGGLLAAVLKFSPLKHKE